MKCAVVNNETMY